MKCMILIVIAMMLAGCNKKIREARGPQDTPVRVQVAAGEAV